MKDNILSEGKSMKSFGNEKVVIQEGENIQKPKTSGAMGYASHATGFNTNSEYSNSQA